MITVHFLSPRGERITVDAKPGDSVLDVANAHDIEVRLTLTQCAHHRGTQRIARGFSGDNGKAH